MSLATRSRTYRKLTPAQRDALALVVTATEAGMPIGSDDLNLPGPCPERMLDALGRRRLVRLVDAERPFLWRATLWGLVRARREGVV